MNYILKNVDVVDKNKTVKNTNLYIENALIEKISDEVDENLQSYDCTGLTVMPSFVDLHAHFRDPGYTHKETIQTGSKAAVKGGYTLINLMANTKPIANDMQVVNYVLDKAKKIGLINIHQCVSVTNDFDGESLEHLDKIDTKKVKFISDDGKGIISNLTSYKSMLIAKEKNLTIMTHAEDKYLTPIDYRLSEDIITIRDLYLCHATGARLHLSHVSTIDSLEAIRLAKQHGTNVTCEVTPHHIALYDNEFKVNPPIRTQKDVYAVIEAIKDGTIDAISTDHAPHTAEEKKNGAPGLVGLETAFGVCYSNLVKPNHITLNKLSELISYNPYKIFDGMYEKRGLIKQGYVADLALVDINKTYTVDPNNFDSMGKNTPFKDKQLQGIVVATIKDGEFKYDNR